MSLGRPSQLVDPLLAVVALGSNLGESAQILGLAMEQLEYLSVGPIVRSSLWRTAPVDCPPGSSGFINAVAILTPRSTEPPELLLRKLQKLEKEFGRRPKRVMNEARPLDLDLIAFGSERRDTPELTLPHPRAHKRKFVLAPLAEIAPELVLPGRKETVVDLLNETAPEDQVERLI